MIKNWKETIIKNSDLRYNYMPQSDDIGMYYFSDDNEIINNDIYSINLMRELRNDIYKGKTIPKSRFKRDEERKLIKYSKFVYKFNLNNQIFLKFTRPDTVNYHIDALFNNMIDICDRFNLVDNKGDYIIKKEFREKFYEFCFLNSKMNLKKNKYY